MSILIKISIIDIFYLKVTYRKIPIISPGLTCIFAQKACLVGLFLGAYLISEFYGILKII